MYHNAWNEQHKSSKGNYTVYLKIYILVTIGTDSFQISRIIKGSCRINKEKGTNMEKK